MNEVVEYEQILPLVERSTCLNATSFEKGQGAPNVRILFSL